jgi:hypothetical protein
MAEPGKPQGHRRRRIRSASPTIVRTAALYALRSDATHLLHRPPGVGHEVEHELRDGRGEQAGLEGQIGRVRLLEPDARPGSGRARRRGRPPRRQPQRRAGRGTDASARARRCPCRSRRRAPGRRRPARRSRSRPSRAARSSDRESARRRRRRRRGRQAVPSARSCQAYKVVRSVRLASSCLCGARPTIQPRALSRSRP